MRKSRRSWLARAALATLVSASITLPPAGSPWVGVPVARAQEADDESALYVEEARAAIRKNDLGRAAGLLDKAIALNPRRIDAYILRATVHALKKEYGEAVAVLRRARQLAPDNPHVLTLLGTQLLLVARADEAVPLLEDVVRRWPDRYEAWASLGHHYARTGKWTDAIRAHEAYFRTRPKALAADDARHKLSLADAYLRSGDPIKARTLYREVLAKDERSILGRLGLAWSTAAVDCGEALPLLAAMNDLAEKYPAVLQVHARCAIVLGKDKEALALAQRLTDRSPEDPRAWGLLGEARLATGDLKGSGAAFQKALERDPKNKLYAYHLARSERRGGQPQAAAARLVKAGAPEGYEADWHIELAEAYGDSGQPAEVVRLLRPFVAASPGVATTHVLYGIALLDVAEPAAAIVELEKGLALDPSQERAKPALVAALNLEGVAAFRKGDAAGAEQRLARAAELGDDVTTLRNLGAVRLIAGRPEAALAPLERAAGLPGAATDPTVHHLLGRALFALGKPRPALAALRQAVKLSGAGDDPRGVDARIDLASISLELGEPAAAVEALEPALDVKDKDRAARVLAAWSSASRAAATQWMKSGAFERAYRQLEALEKRLPKDLPADAVLAVRCDLALAATGAGARDNALKRLRQLEKDKVSCPYAAPADKLAITILIAWNEGSYPGRADAALGRLNKLRKSATGPARPLVRDAARYIALRAAADQFVRGNAAKSKAYLAIAARWEDGASPETQHNLAVLELDEGDVDGAIRAFETLIAQVPEALIHLGLAWEKKGDPEKALDYFRKALAANVSFGPLRGWIAAREHLWEAR